jgi:predicted anti-sigma-YlaC factor YlaD
VLLLVTSGCSIRRYAINRIGDALASGTSTYTSDDDLELVGEALPFGLKLIESLLSESPKHKGLLLAACEGFTSYTWVYVQQEADRVAQEDLQRARQMRTRAQKLYLRAHGYGLRRLEASYQGMTQRLETDLQAALSVVKKEDIPSLYWTAAALGLAISVSKNDAEMLARLPEVEVFLEQALALDESWDDGALHEFQVTLAGAKPGAPAVSQIKKHFDRALTLSRGAHAGLFVAYAEVVSVKEQNRSEFRSLLERALAIDPAQYEEVQLVNLVAQERARWLLGRIDELFLEEDASNSEGGLQG